MKIDPRLHHYAQNIVPNSLERVIEMYVLLGCKVVYRPNNGYNWAMVAQEPLNFAIQIVEVEEKPIIDLDIKRKVHIAFLSDNPKKIIQKIEGWAKQNNIAFREGGWSEKERYFDLPEIFVNFVVEVMHTSIEEE